MWDELVHVDGIDTRHENVHAHQSSQSHHKRSASQGSILLVLIILAFIFAIEGADMQIMALAVPVIAPEWRMDPSAFGPTLSAALIGIAFGSAILGSRADRVGNKSVIVLSLIVVAIGSLIVAAANSLFVAFVGRIVTGIGVGGCMACVNAMAVEYAPERHRATILSSLACSFAAGSFLIGIAAPSLMGLGGWRGLFVFGAVLPLALAILTGVGVPPDRRAVSNRGLTNAQGPGDPRPGLLAIWSPSLRVRTAQTWLMWFAQMFVLYGLASWLPTMLRNSGASLEASLTGASMVWLGGFFGGPLLGWLFDRARSGLPMIIALGPGLITTM